MAATENLQSDEEFARQLQREEYGSLVSGSYFGMARPSSNGNNSSANNNNNNNLNQDISAPLLNDNPNANPNMAMNPLLNDFPNNNASAALDANPAQQARRNVIDHVRDADTDSPRILLLRIVIALVEIIATATVLAIGWNEGANTSCNYLKWWALIYTSRHLITIPLRVHIYRLNRQPIDNVQEQANHNVATEKAIQMLRWLSIMTFLLFLLGQTFLFTEKTCQDAAPTVWYYCLVIIILVYVSLALPFLIVLAICICLPCVLIIFRFFAEPEGADDRIIKDLPTRKITSDDLKRVKEEKENTVIENTDIDQAVAEEEEEEEEEGPACAICMQPYKIGDELRILPCQHEFHCECVDKWLPMKKICPLCRHDITKKVSENENNNDENV